MPHAHLHSGPARPAWVMPAPPRMVREYDGAPSSHHSTARGAMVLDLRAPHWPWGRDAVSPACGATGRESNRGWDEVPGGQHGFSQGLGGGVAGPKMWARRDPRSLLSPRRRLGAAGWEARRAQMRDWPPRQVSQEYSALACSRPDHPAVSTGSMFLGPTRCQVAQLARTRAPRHPRSAMSPRQTPMGSALRAVVG